MTDKEDPRDGQLCEPFRKGKGWGSNFCGWEELQANISITVLALLENPLHCQVCIETKSKLFTDVDSLKFQQTQDLKLKLESKEFI